MRNRTEDTPPLPSAGVFPKRHPMIRTVETTIRDHGMFQVGERVLVGVSGGADSIALLHALLELRPVFDLHLEVAHLNHNLRGAESRRDSDFVASVAKRHDLAFHLEQMDDDRLINRCGESLEEAARTARYEFLERTATKTGCQKIALGHHAADSAELILMNIIRGSGPAGLCGIAPVRDGHIVRPLIRLDRRTLQAYLTDHGYEWVEDSSNADGRFMRNRVRHLLIPMLEEKCNPSVRSSLIRLGGLLRDENEWIESLLEPVFHRLVHVGADGRIRLFIPEMQALPAAVQRRMILAVIHRIRGDAIRLSLAHVEAVRTLILGDRSTGAAHLPGGVHVLKQEGMVVFSLGRPRPAGSRSGLGVSDAPVYAYTLFRDGFFPLDLTIVETGVRLRFSVEPKPNRMDVHRDNPRVAYCDLTKTQIPWIVRNAAPGDRFRPLGLNGSQKVKKMFIDRKIPREQRVRYPVVADRNHILWIAGLRMDDRCKVDASTRNVLKMELLLA